MSFKQLDEKYAKVLSAVSSTAGVYYLYLGDKFYIGSSINMKRRLIQHLYDLHRGDHLNKKMQEAFDHLGHKGVRAYVITHVPHASALMSSEQYFLDRYHHLDKCLNICGDVGAPMTGRTHSDATRAQMSASRSRRVSVTLEKTFSSRIEAAEYFGVHPTTVSRWVKGTIKPPAKHEIAEIK